MYSWSKNHDNNLEIFIFIWFSATKWFSHISKYLSFLFALFWSVDMPDIWFWVSGWVLILVTVTGNGLVIYFIMTKLRRQILLHRLPHPCWSLFSESASPSCIAPTPISSPWRSTASLPSQCLCGTCLTWWKKLFGWWLLRFGMAHFYSSFCLPSSLTITIRHLPCSWKYPEFSFSRFCPSLSLSLRLLISFALPGKSTARPGNWLQSSPPQPCYEHEWTEHPATCSNQSATQEFHRLDHIGDDRLQYHVPRRELPLSLLSHQFMSLRWDAQIYGLSGADWQHCCQSSSLFLL